MENNNWKWYEENQPENSTSAGVPRGDAHYAPGSGYRPYQGAAGYGTDGPKDDRKRFSWIQLIACLMVMALLAGAAGAGFATLISNGGSQAQSAENPGGGSEDGTSAGGESAANTPAPQDDAAGAVGAKASEGIQLGSLWSAEDAVSDMLQRCMASVVGIDIISEVSTGSYWYGEPGTSTEKVGSGSGVILTSDGYIATCSHVVSGVGANGTIKVYLQDGSAYDAAIVGADDMTDLAILKIEAANLPAAAVGSSGEALIGDRVYAIGNPLGVLASSVSDGIVSGLDRLVSVVGADMTLMQTDAAVNPGNSGGGLFNSAGELIGIVNAKATGENVEGIGFAIPIDSALPVIRDLMDLGYVSGRPYLGITPVDVYMAGSPGFFGFSNYVVRAQVRSVEAGGPADKAGMKEGDVILTLDGKDVYGASELSVILYEYKIGDTVTISVLRGERQMDLTVTLGERPR